MILNVCLGDCECGMLKMALECREPITFSHRLLQLGRISPEHFDSARREWIAAFFSNCTRREQRRIWRADRARFKWILKMARKEKKLRICAMIDKGTLEVVEHHKEGETPYETMLRRACL